MLFTLFLSSSILSADVFSMLLKAILYLFMGYPNSQGGFHEVSNTSTLMEGSYYLESSSNFDAYLAELGVGYILRNLAQLAKPTIHISRFCPDNAEIESSTCDWKIRTETSFKSHQITFKLGDKVGDLTMDGRSTISLFTVKDEDTLIEHVFGDVNTTLSRDFDLDKMKVTMSAGDVTATSTFPRVKPRKKINEKSESSERREKNLLS